MFAYDYQLITMLLPKIFSFINVQKHGAENAGSTQIGIYFVKGKGLA